MKVYNMKSQRTGNAVANQFIIETNEGTYFQSYSTVIAKKHDNCVELDPDWNISRTTMKYLSEFLGGANKSEIEKRIREGIYKVKNLN